MNWNKRSGNGKEENCFWPIEDQTTQPKINTTLRTKGGKGREKSNLVYRKGDQKERRNIVGGKRKG